MSDWKADDARYLFQNYGRQPILIERGEGTRVWDDEGREYLDFVGGLAVTALGHNHPAVVDAVSDQARKVIHMSNLYYTRPMIDLAQFLVDHSPFDRAFFCNSGSEANETAIKLARRWGHDQKDGAHEIISTINGFHGRTIGALAATGTPRYREPFEPMPAGFVQVPWDDVEAIESATTSRTAAVLLEPIQGEGGVNMPSPGYFRAVRDWCDERGILLIVDEIQTGCGRTGRLWAHEHEEIAPDVMTLAKALGNGVPIGAVLAREDVARHLVPGDHGTTFGANPLAAAAALATMRTIVGEELPAKAAETAEYITGRFRAMEDQLGLVNDVRGRGLMLALGFTSDVAPNVVAGCRDRGLLVNNVRPNAIRILPPLNITNDEAATACDIIEEVVRGLETGAEK